MSLLPKSLPTFWAGAMACPQCKGNRSAARIAAASYAQRILEVLIADKSTARTIGAGNRDGEKKKKDLVYLCAAWDRRTRDPERPLSICSPRAPMPVANGVIVKRQSNEIYAQQNPNINPVIWLQLRIAKYQQHKISDQIGSENHVRQRHEF